MTTTKVYNGQLITSTTTEQDLEPVGPFEDGTTVLMCLDVQSGTVKFGVGAAGGSPIIDGDLGTWGSYTTSNPKATRTIDPGKSNLRCVGVGTFTVSW
jgi:hypothetical protein